MRASIVLGIIAAFVCAGVAFAETPQAGQGGPCHEIRMACEQAGFVQGEAKLGYGLWVDCIDPIMQGKPAPHKAIKPLPNVDPKLVAECRAKNPQFGMGQKKPKAK